MSLLGLIVKVKISNILYSSIYTRKSKRPEVEFILSNLVLLRRFCELLAPRCCWQPFRGVRWSSRAWQAGANFLLSPAMWHFEQEPFLLCFSMRPFFRFMLFGRPFGRLRAGGGGRQADGLVGGVSAGLIRTAKSSWATGPRYDLGSGGSNGRALPSCCIPEVAARPAV